VATEEKKDTFTVDYSGDSDTPTGYAYLAGGGLKKEHREQVAKEAGVKEADHDFEVIRDDIGRELTVRVVPKEKAKA
jgi:hypothetical protein